MSHRQVFAHAFAKEKARNTHTALSATVPTGQLFVPNPKLRLREQLREVMRFHHYAVKGSGLTLDNFIDATGSDSRN